jgi:hypothetical protein
MIMELPLKIPLPVFILFFLFLLLIGGWFNRNQLMVQFYFMRFQTAQSEDIKCRNLLQILRVSREANLESVIQRAYPEGQYHLRRSAFLLGGYAVAELEENAESVARQKEWKGSMLQVVLLQKKSNGDFQIIYSCGKFMG